MHTYHLGIDYFFHFEDFPHMGVTGAICWNSDCTAEIYINTLYNPIEQQKTIRHELRHFAYDHHYDTCLTLTEKELQADNDDDPNIIFNSDFTRVTILQLNEAS